MDFLDFFFLVFVIGVFSKDRNALLIAMFGSLVGFLVDFSIFWDLASFEDISQTEVEFTLLGTLVPDIEDGFSDIFSWFTSLLFFVVDLIAYKTKYEMPLLYGCLLLINIPLQLIFSVGSVLWFYIYFETILIPMYLIIGVFGSRRRRIMAAYQFFLYTLFGSIFMLLSIYILYSHTSTFGLVENLTLTMSVGRQRLCWALFFLGLMVKVPMFPLHIWLPEAHVEAPTIGSVLLAGILLKLGGYGIIRFLFPLFPAGTVFFTPIVITFLTLGIIYASLGTLVQVDIKKMVAYSSIGHMNYGLLGLFALNAEGLVGSIYLMVAHGFASSGLFCIVGMLYDRYKTRILTLFGGISVVMPYFTFFFFIFTLANLGFPGTLNFIGEFLVLVGIIQKNTTVSVLAATSVIWSAAYALILFTQVMYGSFRVSLRQSFDVTPLEMIVLVLLAFPLVFLGLFGNLILGVFIDYMFVVL